MFRTNCYEHHSGRPIYEYVLYVEWVLYNFRHESVHHNSTERFLQNPSHSLLIPYVKFSSALSPHSYKSELILTDEIQLFKAKSRKDRHDKNLTPHPFKINDSVILRTHKLSNAIEKSFFCIIEVNLKLLK